LTLLTVGEQRVLDDGKGGPALSDWWRSSGLMTRDPGGYQYDAKSRTRRCHIQPLLQLLLLLQRRLDGSLN